MQGSNNQVDATTDESDEDYDIEENSTTSDEHDTESESIDYGGCKAPPRKRHEIHLQRRIGKVPLTHKLRRHHGSK